MKTNKLHQFLSILMTLLVTMSSFSMTIRNHYCGDDLIDVSTFSISDPCISGDSCSMSQETANFECCYDIIEIVENHEFLRTGSFDELKNIHKNFLNSYLYSTTQLFDDYQDQTIPHNYYRSPPLIFDFHILHEIYLI